MFRKNDKGQDIAARMRKKLGPAGFALGHKNKCFAQPSRLLLSSLGPVSWRLPPPTCQNTRTGWLGNYDKYIYRPLNQTFKKQMVLFETQFFIIQNFGFYEPSKTQFSELKLMLAGKWKTNVERIELRLQNREEDSGPQGHREPLPGHSGLNTDKVKI